MGVRNGSSEAGSSRLCCMDLSFQNQLGKAEMNVTAYEVRVKRIYNILLRITARGPVLGVLGSALFRQKPSVLARDF
jgi:hypothetical protein